MLRILVIGLVVLVAIMFMARRLKPPHAAPEPPASASAPQPDAPQPDTP